MKIYNIVDEESLIIICNDHNVLPFKSYSLLLFYSICYILLNTENNYVALFFSECDIAGKTADYVNRVILNVESGDPSGGLEIRRKRKS